MDLTTFWWGIMVVINIINFSIGIKLFFKPKGFQAQEWVRDQGYPKYYSYMRILGIIFVLVAFYRSIFVSSYPNRLVWFDTILNSPFIIRSLATFAEMSFIGIIAGILIKINKGVNDESNLLLNVVPHFAIVCIFIAQFFAFAGLITQFYMPFVVEELLWGIAFLSIMPLVIIRLRQSKRLKNTYSYGTYNTYKTLNRYKPFLIVMTIWCVGYTIFQFFFALPFMYFPEAALDVYKTMPINALYQSIFTFYPTQDLSLYGGIGFAIWHSGYFSVCVWMVLYFMYVCRKDESEKKSVASI